MHHIIIGWYLSSLRTRLCWMRSIAGFFGCFFFFILCSRSLLDNVKLSDYKLIALNYLKVANRHKHSRKLWHFLDLRLFEHSLVFLPELWIRISELHTWLQFGKLVYSLQSPIYTRYALFFRLNSTISPFESLYLDIFCLLW